MKKHDLLLQLTGLNSDELGHTLLSNPRAYMALKGAVAESHLENLLTKLKFEKKIFDFRKGIGDFEKDFYIKRHSKDRELALECKNVEVIKLNTHSVRSLYLRYLKDNNLVAKFEHDLEAIDARMSIECMKALSIEHRESGLSRYSFSKSVARIDKNIQEIGPLEYLGKFNSFPITIDFQRTRNSRDEDAQDNKSARFYKAGEIDLVGACLFTRTLSWDFVFCSADKFQRHRKYPDSYSNSLALNPKDWELDLIQVIKRIK
jgi:hypothetical protein